MVPVVTPALADPARPSRKSTKVQPDVGPASIQILLPSHSGYFLALTPEIIIHDDNLVVTGGTGGCHDNIQCHQ